MGFIPVCLLARLCSSTLLHLHLSTEKGGIELMLEESIKTSILHSPQPHGSFPDYFDSGPASVSSKAPLKEPIQASISMPDGSAIVKPIPSKPPTNLSAEPEENNTK